MRGIRMVVVLLVLVYPALVQAQIDSNWPVIAVGPGKGPDPSCDDAPLLCMGGSYVLSPGTFEVFIYPAADSWSQISECSLGLSYPSDWSILEVDLCAGTLLEGDLYNLRNGVRIGFSPCISDQHVLHLIVSATSVGRLQIGRGPGQVFGSRGCSGIFHEYFGRPAYIDVGDVCGGFPMIYPCDYCTLHWGDRTQSASFDPPSLQISLRQGEVSTVQVQNILGATQCQLIPECSSFPQDCGGVFLSQVEWLAITDMGDGQYEARIDTSQLLPGAYEGGGEVEGQSCCSSECWPVTLEVLPAVTAVGEPALVPASWGQIKSVYR